MKKIVSVFLFAIVVMIAFAATPGRSSSGAPPSHTGAPDEKTCATAGCHDDAGEVNSGTATLEMELGNSIKNYVAGKTYAVKVRISDSNKSRFGFQILAMDPESKTSVGKFTITDKERTQLVSNSYELKDREYVTYTFNGTDAVSNGLGEWVVNWTAPENATKPVVFYLAGVSANDDMSDKGDKVYTRSFTFNK